MSQLLLFALMMCSQTGIGVHECIKKHEECIQRNQKYAKYLDDPIQLCDNAIANYAWEKTKRSCK